MNDLLERLPEDDRALAVLSGECASKRGYDAFLVGGIVRDLLLGVASPDIDIVVEGDGIVVAQDVARELGGEVVRHHAFQTATVTLEADGRRVDFATARSETYAKQGALPAVSAGTIEDDLGRRDFTINTMAVEVTPAAFGRLVDPFGGREDIAARSIRFLHEQSFSDDPTRLLRALRFALRLDYEIETRTADAIRAAAQGRFLGDISGDRMRRELAKLLEEQPVDGPAALEDWHLLPDIFAGLSVDRDALSRLPAGGAGLAWQVLAVMAVDLAPQDRWDLAHRLRLTREGKRVLVGAGADWSRARRAVEALDDEARPSAVARVLDPLPVAVLEVGAAIWPAGTEWIEPYLERDREVTCELRGDDLMALGVPEGEELGEVLAALRYARIDGEVASRADEERLARRLAAESN